MGRHIARARGLRVASLALALAMGSAIATSTAKDDSVPPSPPDAASRPDAVAAFFDQRLTRAEALAGKGQFAAADTEVTRLLADIRFGQLPTVLRHATLSTGCWVAAGRDALKRALGLCRQASRYAESSPNDWYRLALLEWSESSAVAAVDAMIEFIQRWPDALDQVDEVHLHGIRVALEPGSSKRVALAQTLLDANWQSPYGSDGIVWYELAAAYVDAGEPDLARLPLRRIRTPLDVVRVRSERRFDGLYDPRDPAFDAGLAVDRQIETMQLRVRIAPHDIRARVTLAHDLLVDDRHEAVIALAEDTLARMDAPAGDGPAFSEPDDRVWLMNYRAIALRRLGRIQEAVDELARASQLEEDGMPNVSQKLNLGDLMCGLERPDAALRAIAETGPLSDVGQNFTHLIRYCVALQQGRDDDAGRSLDYLRTHSSVDPGALVEALMRGGHVDEAARRVIELLDGRAYRGQTLEWMQDFNHPEPLPGNAGLSDTRRALLLRDDVRAAIERVGRIERYPFNPYADMN